jgi:hypothetical protein
VSMNPVKLIQCAERSSDRDPATRTEVCGGKGQAIK